jgi:hypothetical protein
MIGNIIRCVRRARGANNCALLGYRLPLRDRKFADSPLEQVGFEPSVPYLHAHHEEAHSAEADAKFRKLTEIYLAIVAMLLAITALCGSNATKTMLNSNIQAADIYGYYQAKNIRQTVYQLTAEQLDSELIALPEMPEAARAKIQDRIQRYRERVDRYESDPSTGKGKKQLLAKAKEWEAKRDQAAERDPNFDFAEAYFRSRLC